jgi:serine/threonine protein kinase
MQHVGPATRGMRARDQLDAVLDDMRVHGQLLFGTYIILSSLERRGGGQGCVQFVHDRDKRRDLAVKFFFKLDAFEREAALYADPVLRAMMAATRHVYANADGALKSPDGYAFPPHIVIERGEPLDEWMKRMVQRTAGGKLPLIAIFQALINIAERLLLLHDAGYVHGDLKPSNVLWLADMHAWTLIDFGSTAKAGAHPGRGIALIDTSGTQEGC